MTNWRNTTNTNTNLEGRKVMEAIMNTQTKNVGNLGDILKHAALLNLASTLKSRVKTDICYVETHSFILKAAIQKGAEWADAVDALMAAHAGYGIYADAERAAVTDGAYWCSAALVMDTLRPDIAYLAEKDDNTRRILREQAEVGGFADATVFADACESLPEIVDHKTRDGFLMLVDPFEDPREIWDSVDAITAAQCSKDTIGAIEVFAYDRAAAFTDWPKAPANFIGPVSTVNKGFYNIAVYATEAFEDDASTAINDLGW